MGKKAKRGRTLKKPQKTGKKGQQNNIGETFRRRRLEVRMERRELASKKFVGGFLKTQRRPREKRERRRST